ncbi:hypothetical protein [Parvimonas sp. C2]|uniref:hypothetical protein n=1 Tax=Parvimonas sp. C2 TaxID=3110692 RepID=UPI002B458F17|nr:hypothetical protein [Parvimonas sp. C2]MEB3073079.1 hypothetical protein [Parvimonas sp. C2]
MNILSIYSFFSILFFKGGIIDLDLDIPIWFFWVFPVSWIAIIPITAILCSIVIYISMYRLKINDCFSIFVKTIIKLTCFNFLCDLIVIVFIYLGGFGIESITSTNPEFYHWYKNIFLNALQRNPFSNVFSLLFLSSIILLVRIINYQLNKRFTFSKLDIEEENKKKLALSIAIFTAPYIFFLTTS